MLAATDLVGDATEAVPGDAGHALRHGNMSAIDVQHVETPVRVRRIRRVRTSQAGGAAEMVSLQVQGGSLTASRLARAGPGLLFRADLGKSLLQLRADGRQDVSELSKIKLAGERSIRDGGQHSQRVWCGHIRHAAATTTASAMHYARSYCKRNDIIFAQRFLNRSTVAHPAGQPCLTAGPRDEPIVGGHLK
jgi:hypothetical protein